jgi:hypothetical protein
MQTLSRGVRRTVLALIVSSAMAGACAREPATPADTRAHGQALVRAMSDRLAKATAFTVKTRDTRTRSGQSQPVRTERTFSVRRPDRVAFTALGEQSDLKGWYRDGKVTLVSPGARVWARVRGDATIDDTLDRLAERFEMQMPMADFFYSAPYDALIADGMKGGYVGRETIDQVACAHITFADDLVEWRLWLPESGEPLPKKYRVTAKRLRGQPTSEVLFLDWNLTTPAPDSAFEPQVPDGFERIPVASRHVAPLPRSPSARGTTGVPTP